jgi:co-chaperonin GroES (HSP10)
MALTKEQYIEKHFPDIDPGAKPTGNQVMIQLRTAPKKSGGGIVLVEETKDFNKGNTQVARLVRVGQIAYKDRNSGEAWKEGAWAEVGDLVLAPRYGGFRFEVPSPGEDEDAVFAIINDYDVKMVIEGNFEAFDRIL